MKKQDNLIVRIKKNEKIWRETNKLINALNKVYGRESVAIRLFGDLIFSEEDGEEG